MSVSAGAGSDVVSKGGESEPLLTEWLRKEAAAGDEEAQYCLVKLFSPPPFALRDRCQAPDCGLPFGITCYRHHCRHCGGSFCHAHSWQTHAIPKLALPARQRVCRPCKRRLELEDWSDRVGWRLARVDAYLAGSGRLTPYFDTGLDTGVDKALRCVDGAIYVAKATPGMSTAVKVSAEVMDALIKYGTVGVAGLLLRREFVEAVELLKRASGVDKAWPMSVHEITAAMYYILSERRGERGADPDGEERAHAG
ncbi:unnamed protein product, partial [Phaeothamnion confervicola]